MKFTLQAFLFLLLSTITFSTCTQEETSNRDYNISVNWQLLKHMEYNGNPSHEAIFTITNNSEHPLTDDWELYWNQSPRGILKIDSTKHVAIKRLNGDFYRMRPLKDFKLAAKNSVDISMIGNAWLIKESDGPVGVYAVFNPGENQNIKAIEDFKITAFTRPEQINRSKTDEVPIPTAQSIFKENENLNLLPNDQLYKGIPSPKSYKAFSGFSTLKPGYTIHTKETTENEARILMIALRDLYGLNGKMTSTFGEIVLKIDNKIAKEEGYQLKVSKDKIEITGKDNAGVFYGIQTLLNLIEKKDKTFRVRNCIIEDAPAYAYRGIHIDVGRNFHSKETLLKMIDILSQYKINKVVLGLTEDEGWRLEIDGLPELTEVGSKRGHPTDDQTHLQPAYGSGPFTNSITGSGFYSRSDFKEIIKYAHDRHVDIIPMVNFPGHARAAIIAMEHRYHKLMKADKEEEAVEFRLADPDDKSEYVSAQQFHDNISCVCQPSTYKFYEFVVDDILEMYQEAGVPIYMFHTGGDEVPKGSWAKSPICEEYRKDYPEITDARNFQSHFFDKITKLLQSKNVRIGGWEEAVMSYDENGKWFTNTQFTDREVYPYIWNNLWGQQDLGYKIANRGYPIVLCNVTNFYFDLAYDKDPREPGLYWGGFVNTKGPFSFIPEDLFLSTTHDVMGKKFNQAVDFKDLERLTPEGYQNIVGLQAQLWSETVKGENMLESYIFPKLFGFSQRAWEGQPSWGNQKDEGKRNTALNTDWNRFANTISQSHLPKLDDLNGGYYYHLPKPGVVAKDGKLSMNSAFPGMEIRYTTDGSDPTKNSQVYEGPVDFEGGTVIAKVFNSKGRAGLSTTFSTEDARLQD